MITFEKKSKYGDFNDTLGMSIDTGDKWLNKKLNVNLCYGKGGGGGGSQPQDVPKTLQPYVKDVLGKAKGLYGSFQRFQGYPGERIVGFSPQEQAAMGGIEGLVGRGISATPGLTDASTYYAPALGLLGRSGALGARAVEDIGAEEIMGRMSPYQQAVTDIAKRKAVEEGKQYMTELGGQAARTGGFGGSRQAILEGMAAGDLGQRLTDIQTTGSQAAYQDAVRAAEAQRARLSGGATQAGALSQAFGGLGQQALGQGYREQGYLSGVGEQQRGMQQQRADLAYQQFVEEREFPSTQLQKYSSLIQGFPFQFSQTPQQPSSFQTAAGGIATLGGLGRGLGFFNKGGDIGKGGLSGVVKGQVGSSVGGLEDLSLKEAYEQYLNLARQGKTFDREKEEARLKSEQGFKIAQLGANILAADPSRGGLAAIGSVAPQAIEGLMEGRREREGLDEAERLASMKDLLSQATILEKLKDIETIGQADIENLGRISDTEFENVETAVSELSGPAAKRIKGLTPSQRQELRNQAVSRAVNQYSLGEITRSKGIYETAQRNIYKDLLEGIASTPDADAGTDAGTNAGTDAGSPSDTVQSKTPAEIRAEAEAALRRRQGQMGR